MNSREILLYFALKNEGNWDLIWQDLETRIEPPEEDVKKALKSITSKYITFLDDEYPESLKQIFKPPFVLFYYGDISLISDKNNKLAVVGCRKMSEYGEKMTNELVGELCNDFVIVSGGAVGIDGTAHRAAINNGGKTVMILGNGVNFTYLKANEDIYNECRKHHLVISEYPEDTDPNPFNFPIRNRIIAGLTNNLLVVEGQINSGTQVTAFLMAEKDGNVCCVPSEAGKSSICNKLISDGAFLVETAQDIYEISKVIPKKAIFDL